MTRYLVFTSLLSLMAPVLALAAPTTSANWSGYVAESGTYTGVGASWVVPGASRNTDTIAGDATWVGIGGSSTRDLIQAGTEAVVTAGRVRYQAWYELLPGAQQIIPLAIREGDTVNVSLLEASEGRWLLAFTNTTTGKAYSTYLAYDSSHTSAEWVEEAPLATGGAGSRLVPLDGFGSVAFTHAFAIKDGERISAAGAGAYPVAMARRGIALATPSALAGDSFSVSQAPNNGSIAETEELSPMRIYRARYAPVRQIVIIWMGS